MRTMHLFAGIGGGLLADLILGHRPVVAVEWEPYACRVLRERAVDGWFPDLRVWEGDVRLFDPSEYTGIVDCIHAGFPCQDISVAGKQAGVSEGTRSGLYREVLRIAGVVRPKQLFLENVSAILSNGLGTVLGDLASMGYDCRWLCIRASDVGATHHRDRWFLMGNSNISGLERSHDNEQASTRIQQEHLQRCEVVAYTDSTGQQQGYEEMERGFSEQSDCCCFQPSEDVSYANSAQRKGKRESISVDQEHSATRRFGWWQLEPELGRVANGVPNRVGQLKGYGNAQVPLQAAAAYRLLGGL